MVSSMARRAPRPAITGDWSRMESFVVTARQSKGPWVQGRMVRCDLRRRASPTEPQRDLLHDRAVKHCFFSPTLFWHAVCKRLSGMQLEVEMTTLRLKQELYSFAHTFWSCV